MPILPDRALGLPPLTITKEIGFWSIESGMEYAMRKSLHCQTCGHLFADYRFNKTGMLNLYTDYQGRGYSIHLNIYEP